MRDERGLAAAIMDGFPVSPGHTLVVPLRHVTDFLDLAPDEERAIMAVVREVAATLLRNGNSDGLNVGVNIGAAAGQTISHLHWHVIPRFVGDVEDPRGGIRWVLPEKARYWDA